jgi:hypothetical protein
MTCTTPRFDAWLHAHGALARVEWWIAYGDVAFVSEVHSEVHIDAEHRLHALRGPALAYADGFEVYAYHGTRVRALAITNPRGLLPLDLDLSESQTQAEAILYLTDKDPARLALAEALVPATTLSLPELDATITALLDVA